MELSRVIREFYSYHLLSVQTSLGSKLPQFWKKGGRKSFWKILAWLTLFCYETQQEWVDQDDYQLLHFILFSYWCGQKLANDFPAQNEIEFGWKLVDGTTEQIYSIFEIGTLISTYWIHYFDINPTSFFWNQARKYPSFKEINKTCTILF